MKKIVIASVAALALSSTLMAAINVQACAACHGQNLEKAAMGKSAIVQDMTHAEIERTLLGYKNTPGFGHSPMKGAMAGQVKKYSDEEIKAFSQTVGK